MSAPARRVAELRLAFQLLTRLPVGTSPGTPPPLAAAFWAFPLAGAVAGAVVGGVYWAAAALGLPALAAAVVGLAAGVLVTGALHEDGLADTADGLGGGRDRARKLEIMRDSRIGSYGVLALILAMGLRLGCVAALPPGGATLALLAGIGALSRAVLPPLILALPPARADGLGRLAAEGAPKGRPAALAGGALALGAAGMLPGGLALVLAAGAGAVAVGLLARRQIGGITGDILGAAAVTAELAALCATVAR